MQSITDDFKPIFSSIQKKYASTVCVSTDRERKHFIQVILMESNYLPQNVRERREAGNSKRLEPIDKRRTNVQKALRMEQEADNREYLAKCQQARHYNKHDIKILNQSLIFYEVF